MTMMSLRLHNDIIYTSTAYKNASIQVQSLQSAMKSISPAKQDLMISLLNSGLSTRAVTSQTGLSRSKVSNIAQEMLPNKENLKGGHPSKLSPRDRRVISLQIHSGRAENAVEIAQNLNPTLPSPVSVQTIRNALKKDDFRPVVKKKKLHLSPSHKRLRLAFACKYKTGLWKTGNMLFGQMRPKSIDLGQMARSGCGKRRGSHSWIER